MSNKSQKRQREQICKDRSISEAPDSKLSRQVRIFYSWQSDVKPMKNLIQYALEKVKLNDINILPIIDRDTADIPGSPDIGDTIFHKIDNSDVFVADLTIVNNKFARIMNDRILNGYGLALTDNFRRVSNPNVLIELGYALKALGPERIIMIANTDEGNVENLPFDINHKRFTKVTLLPEDPMIIPGTEEYKSEYKRLKSIAKGHITSSVAETIRILDRNGQLFNKTEYADIKANREELTRLLEHHMTLFALETIIFKLERIAPEEEIKLDPNYTQYSDEEKQEKIECLKEKISDEVALLKSRVKQYNSIPAVIRDGHIKGLDFLIGIISDSAYYELKALFTKIQLKMKDGSVPWKKVKQYIDSTYIIYGEHITAPKPEQIFTKHYIDIFNELSISVKKEFSYDRLDSDGNMIFSSGPNEEVVYSRFGNIILKGNYTAGEFDGFIDERFGHLGSASLLHYGNYVGQVKNGNCNGTGMVYSLKGKLLSEGQWEDDELKEGIEYDWLVALKEAHLKYNQGEEDYDSIEGADFRFSLLEQYGKDLIPFMICDSEIQHTRLDRLVIVDRKLLPDNMEELFHIRKFTDFMREKDPEKLEEYIKYGEPEYDTIDEGAVIIED